MKDLESFENKEDVKAYIINYIYEITDDYLKSNIPNDHRINTDVYFSGFKDAIEGVRKYILYDLTDR